MKKILICDDQEMVRAGLEVIVNADPNLEVIGTAENGAVALKMASAMRPDLILMDLRMPKVDGIEATRFIKRELRDVRILALTTYDADEWIFSALEAGADGYLLKDTPGKQLIRAILETLDGKTHLDPNIAGKVVRQLKTGRPVASYGKNELLDSLSQREIEVLKLVGQGFPNSDIAHQLSLSEGTVRNYISAILSKLQLVDRTQAAIFALRNGLADA